MKKGFLFLVLALIFAGCAQQNGSLKVSTNDNIMPSKQQQEQDTLVGVKILCQNTTPKDECIKIADNAYINKDYPSAIYAYDMICSTYQDLNSCLKMAHMFVNGEGVSVNLKVAADIYKRACYRGDKPSCEKYKKLQ